MSYGRGCLPSTPSKIAHRRLAASHTAINASLAIGISNGIELETFGIFDQGGTGTCHAHSLAGAMWCAFKAAGKEIVVPSPLLIASTTYADVQGPADSRGPLQDNGAELQDDANAVSRWGLAPLGPLVVGRNSDVPDQGGDFPEPQLERVVIAGDQLVSGEYAITVDANAPNVVAASLDAGVPVWLGFLVDDAFEQLGPNDVAQPPIQANARGGHAVYLSGHKLMDNGDRQFKVDNSWGGSWALNGTVWVSSAWVRFVWDAWPLTVAK